MDFAGEGGLLDKEMNKSPVRLPADWQLDINALSRLFNDTTTSYKILFFRSLLHILHLREADNPVISLEDIFREMLVRAWYPRVFHHLSFGAADQLGNVFTRFQLVESAGISPQKVRDALRDISISTLVSDLERYVPFRLQSCFFEHELRGVADHKKNGLICDGAGLRWQTASPTIYRYSREGKKVVAIEVHPAWKAYLAANFVTVRDWCNWNWACYLQRNNPNTPAIISKIDVPMERANLSWQTKVWRSAIENSAVRCPYSGEVIASKGFALDHFIPWSLVGHDQIWNLVPVTQMVNSSKGNTLPDPQYISRVAELHANIIKEGQDFLPRNDWLKYLDDLTIGLSLNPGAEINSDVIRSRYESAVFPLIQIGANAGFKSGWRFSRV